MRNNIVRIFEPTVNEQREEYESINAIIDEDIRKNGENCGNCMNHICVQESPYYDYITCKFDRTLEFGYGKTAHKCDKYSRIRLTVEDQVVSS